LVLDLCV